MNVVGLLKNVTCSLEIFFYMQHACSSTKSIKRNLVMALSRGKLQLFIDLQSKYVFKGSDQRENRGVWSNINTRYLVWRCGDGRSFAL
jgi:hypothetical protein